MKATQTNTPWTPIDVQDLVLQGFQGDNGYYVASLDDPYAGIWSVLVFEDEEEFHAIDFILEGEDAGEYIDGDYVPYRSLEDALVAVRKVDDLDGTPDTQEEVTSYYI